MQSKGLWIFILSCQNMQHWAMEVEAILRLDARMQGPCNPSVPMGNGWQRQYNLQKPHGSISLLHTAAMRPCLKNSGKAETSMWGLSFDLHVCASLPCEHIEGSITSQAFLSKSPLCFFDLTLIQPNFLNDDPCFFLVHSSATHLKKWGSFHACSFCFFWLQQTLLVFIGCIFHIRQESQAHKNRIINFMLEKHFSLSDSVNIHCWHDVIKKKDKRIPMTSS